jgi:uncharacterized repeat protein (TIGR03843 family)
VALLGRIVESSNATFLVSVAEVEAGGADPDDDPGDDPGQPLAAAGAEVRVEAGDDAPDRSPPGRRDTSDLPPGLKAVYKPLRGERPLWDFPEGLFRREAAAYELSAALGWDLVPGTVVREDAPLGVGSLQRFVEADFSRHYFVLRDEGHHDGQLMRMCAFDLLANNTDRKGGHVLVDGDDHVWGIDNGLCFSTEARLRTVIWDFAGLPVPDDVMDGVATLLATGLPGPVAALLLDDEAEAVLRRARVLRSARQFPHDPTGRRIPWPLI